METNTVLVAQCSENAKSHLISKYYHHRRKDKPVHLGYHYLNIYLRNLYVCLKLQGTCRYRLCITDGEKGEITAKWLVTGLSSNIDGLTLLPPKSTWAQSVNQILLVCFSMQRKLHTQWEIFPVWPLARWKAGSLLASKQYVLIYQQKGSRKPSSSLKYMTLQVKCRVI